VDWITPKAEIKNSNKGGKRPICQRKDIFVVKKCCLERKYTDKKGADEAKKGRETSYAVEY